MMKGKRNKLSSSKTNIVVETIMPAFVDKRISTPHCIMELSMSEYNRMKKNSIHIFISKNINSLPITPPLIHKESQANINKQFRTKQIYAYKFIH